MVWLIDQQLEGEVMIDSILLLLLSGEIIFAQLIASFFAKDRFAVFIPTLLSAALVMLVVLVLLLFAGKHLASNKHMQLVGVEPHVQ